MDTNLYRDGITTVGLGFHVAKASATVPNASVQDLFTVTGGRILVMCLVGEVTTIMGATANNTKINSNPTTGTTAIVASNLATENDEAGTLYHVEGDGTALVGVNAGFCPCLIHVPWICPVGTIELETGGNNTGATKWDIWYFPLDVGASVASA